MASESKYTLPSAETEVTTLLEKVLHEGLNTTELAAVYDDLSQEYDKVLTESKYYGPNTAAEAVSKIFKPEERPQKIILDIGAGTGLVAEELTKKGFKVFDALDPSSGMLEKAREKGLYRNYICEAIGSKPLNISSGSYDVITVVGSHTKNHIKGEALQEMIRLVKSEQMDTNNYTVPSAETGVTTLLSKVFKDGLNQSELAAAYDDVSKDYDKVLTKSEYVAHKTAAESLAKLIKPDERPQKTILDIGAGTGLVAEELTKIGFKIIDALEPSSGMLEKAREKGLYRKYICEAIGTDPLNIPSGSYDIVTVVGSHTKNHIQSEALEEMIRLVNAGGIICIVSRMEGFYQFDEYKDSFFPFCDKLEKDGKWQKIECSECPFWKTVPGLKFLYRVC